MTNPLRWRQAAEALLTPGADPFEIAAGLLREQWQQEPPDKPVAWTGTGRPVTALKALASIEYQTVPAYSLGEVVVSAILRTARLAKLPGAPVDYDTHTAMMAALWPKWRGPETEESWIIVDASYRADGGQVAAVGLKTLTAQEVSWTRQIQLTQPAPPYIPGSFWRRELPGLRKVLRRTWPIGIVIDGYVDLGAAPGLGRHLFEELRVPVIGVAKTAFAGALAQEVRRGQSAKPLYVTTAGIPLLEAAQLIRDMTGSFRVPTHIKLADRLSRAPLDTK